eukprot:8070416-Pyramimonas_sp.AAC.1
MMLAGALLASICPQSARLSRVGQLFSPDATAVGLAGQVPDKRMAVLRGAQGGSWQSAAPRGS